MNVLKMFTILCLVSFSLFFTACNDGGGGSSDTGTVAMSVTDAKPLLPENVSNVFVTFSEVWVHKPGEGWIQLDLVEPEYTIDLLQFQNGTATELVPPAVLSAGKYTQVRIVVSDAKIRFENEDKTTEDVTLEIPSEKLKTDKNFTIAVGAESAYDIVIHFDLSMSVVVSDPEENPTYMLKPVMHLFEDPLRAATIEGSIDADSFGASNKATIFVIAQSNEEEFTKLEVAKESDTDPTPFSIYWLVPNESYTVKIDLNHDTETIDADCYETVYGNDLEPGETYDLNGGNPIIENDPNGICI
jgi:hypothetical protein